MNYDRLVHYEGKTDGLIEELRELQKKSQTYLQADRRAVIFEGFSEISKMCTHVKISNFEEKPVAFNVRKPQGPSFGVEPNLGILKPGEEMHLYFQFRGRGSRVPDDGAHLFTIYQTKLRAEEEKLLGKYEHPRDRYLFARKIWSHYSNNCPNQLHLPVGFAPKRTPRNLIHAPHNDSWKYREEKPSPPTMTVTASNQTTTKAGTSKTDEPLPSPPAETAESQKNKSNKASAECPSAQNDDIENP
ncbi:hypothetical protein L596_026571 [Steinernema carpocapsae]|uniref:Major sperm protein n=1 Tax=Steinernema carpocapsae TaxID=34508 RepID=A0A4U5M1X1_STECR|nr:hypothetical protein L596_026571 [Steinernema carpocapsae]